MPFCRAGIEGGGREMVTTVLAAGNPGPWMPLPTEVSEPLKQLFRWFLWGVEVLLICRLVWVTGKAGWEHYRPPPGPPDTPGDVARTLAAWWLAATALPLAISLLLP